MKTVSVASFSILFCTFAHFVVADYADTVFVGRNIVTMDASQGDVAAVAVRDGRIVWTGSRADANYWINDARDLVELGEQALLPGFIDAHGHLTFSALMTSWANVASPPVGPTTDIRSLQQTLHTFIDDGPIPAGQWVIGGGYDDSLLAERRHPTRRDLDAVSTAHPIALLHVSGHLATANSLALQLAGITTGSEDPAGGIIRREPGSGRPNGVLEETATYPLRDKMFTQPDDPEAGVLAALADYASFGITTAQDGAASPEAVALLQAIAQRNALTMDVIVYPVARNEPEIPVDIQRLGRYHNRLKLGGIKMILDGSPQGKTAFLTQPYLVPPAGQSAEYRGYPTFSDEIVRTQIKRFLDAGVPILAHANGDAAADMLIDAVALAAPTHDHRTVMIHAQTVREDQLDRMATLKMIPSYFSAHTFYWGDWHRDSVFGLARASRISPTRSTVQRNMVFTTHNDAPIVPPNMLRLLWATTNRITRSGKTLGAEQRISVHEALLSITTHAAYQMFEEDSKGTITEGKWADLVVLSANPMQVAAEDLQDIEVRATYSHGVPIYTR